MTADRYDRFRRLKDLSPGAWERLSHARIAIAGMGVIGCYAADLLVRLGVKKLRIIDRDVLQLSDLGHQILYDELQVKQELPKVEAAAQRLRNINPDVEIEPVFADLNPRTVLKHFDGQDLVLDGLDNLAARYLVNDAALEMNIPWLYCSSAGRSGMVMGVPPGGEPCLRCLVQEYPAPGSTPTCDAIGIWSPAAHWASGQAVWLAIQGLHRQWQDWGTLFSLEQFPSEMKAINVKQNPSCPACVENKRDFLRGDKYPQAFQLCGRNEVSIVPGTEKTPDIKQIKQQWSGPGIIETTPYFARWRDDTHDILWFDDGRVLIRGVESVDEARRLWGRLFAQWT